MSTSAEAKRNASRKYYLKNIEKIRAQKRAYAKANPKKDYKSPKARARAKLTYAVWSGKIIKPEQCEQCSRIAPLHGHHTDYSKPLEVQWLCSACHGLAHRKSGDL